MEPIDRNLCTGCFACADVCPKQAIRIVEAENGFRYPQIDPAKCVDCRLCETVCSYRTRFSPDSNLLRAYGLRHKSPEVLRNSSSGGAFTAISDVILRRGGWIVGSVMDGDHRVRHQITDHESERDRMRGSKYVQSDMEGIFRQIRTALSGDRPVLFVGTPCQAAAVKLYFGDCEKLYVADMLCHGVPSERMFRDHLQYLEQKTNKKCGQYYFRSKAFGWVPSSCEGVRFEGDSRISFPYDAQALSRLYYSGASLRPSCHRCQFRSLHRQSDLTLADFWGIEKVAPDKANTVGSSLLLVNSQKGEELLRAAADSGAAELFELPVEKILFRIPLKPQREIKESAEFWRLYQEAGYEALIRRFAPPALSQKLRFALKKLVRRNHGLQ